MYKPKNITLYQITIPRIIMSSRTKVSLKVLPKKGSKLLFRVDASTSTNNSTVTSNITLRNKSTTLPLAFKVKTNSADSYWVEPKTGILQTGEVINIQIELRPEIVSQLAGSDVQIRTKVAQEMETKDKFLIQSVNLLASELEEMTATNDFETIVFERANSSEFLNTKRTVEIDILTQEEEEEEEEEEEDNADDTDNVIGGDVPPTEPVTETTDTLATEPDAALATEPTTPTPEVPLETKKEPVIVKIEHPKETKKETTTTTATPTLKTNASTSSSSTTKKSSIKAVSSMDLLNSATKSFAINTNDTKAKEQEREKAAAATAAATLAATKKFATLEKELRSTIKQKEKKLTTMSNKLKQTESQLSHSVEQHRTARKSLEALRKFSQETEAREKLISRSSTNNGTTVRKSKGPSEELEQRKSDYWSTMEDESHPKVTKMYPLSYVPGPLSYFVISLVFSLFLVWFLV